MKKILSSLFVFTLLVSAVPTLHAQQPIFEENNDLFSTSIDPYVLDQILSAGGDLMSGETDTDYPEVTGDGEIDEAIAIISDLIGEALMQMLLTD